MCTRIEKYSIDVRKIAQYLNIYMSDLENLYLWKLPTNKQLQEARNIGLISEVDLGVLSNIKSYFHKNIYLKEAISNSIDIKSLNEAHILWIVKEWGGITARSSNDVNDYREFVSTLSNNESVSFKRIASYSKVASFLEPMDYIIYDSRVAYALNWILLKSNASKHFFPMPSGRNSKLMAFNIEVLIRLRNTEKYETKSGEKLPDRFISSKDKQLFIEKNEAYLTMCETILAVNNLLYSSEHEYHCNPYVTEMLLFSIADNEVIKDVVSSLNVDFK